MQRTPSRAADASTVHRVLGFVGEVRAAVLHLRDTGVLGVRMPSLGIAAFLGPLPIEPRQIGSCGRVNPRRLREARQKLLVRLARVPSHDAPQRHVGLERRRIDPGAV